ncbi:VIT and vWA domain-containing protein [Roseibium sp.]|uniref:VIT and vWA domain-containing protein n=1 Tax=Roseibium sp. TaxID=1936156 RepID=UPI003A9762A6
MTFVERRFAERPYRRWSFSRLRIGKGAGIAALALGLSLAGVALARAAAEDDLGGTVVAEAGGKEINLPLLKSDYDVSIEGDLVHVSLTQSFVNPTGFALNATYLFPLNQKAAVHGMRMELDGETIVAQIRRKEEAEAKFQQAKAEGKAASLLTQHRPNMFTQDIANLMPGKTVQITIDYVQAVPKIDGAYELVIPMVVGPRYERVPEAVAADDARKDQDRLAASDDREVPRDVKVVSGWQIDKLPAYPGVIGHDAPGEIDPNRVGLKLSLKAPMPIGAVWSDSHALEIDGGETEKTARFKDGRAIDNRDFVLRYELAAESDVAAGINSHYDAKSGGTFSLLIEPPKVPEPQTIARRELVFVLDTSGSMSGEPMAASKVFMEAAIKALRPDDYFRILRFSSNTSRFAARPLQATEGNRRKALNFVAGLSAGGGTEMNAAINAAFDEPQPADTTRIVVFLTDGYIGDDRNVIATVASRIGQARLYAFGIGSGVNRFLLDGMAKEGRGYARYVGLGETSYEAAQSFAASLKTPVLTDISIDWNGLEVGDQTPAKIPDLFTGGSVRVLGKYTPSADGSHQIFLNALVNGHKARMPLTLELKRDESGDGSRTSALPVIWARERIFDLNRTYTIGGAADDRLKQEIVRLGLAYSLQSRFTSFVAVSEKPVNPSPGRALQASVPLPKVAGVSTNAYPSLNLSGSSAPEPEGLLGAMMVLLAAAVRFRRKLRGAAQGLRRRLMGARRAPEPDTSLPRSLRRDGWWLESR